MNEVILDLPYPPTVNNYKKVGRLIKTKSGKIYQQKVNTDQTKKFYYDVWMIINNMMRSEGLKSFNGDTISIEIDIHSPDKRKRDIDNILKVLIDSLQKAGLFDDDCQIARLLVLKCHTINQGKTIVRIKSL